MSAPTILNLVQGSEEWAKHRATALNASDAPAMMGASKYRSRADLIRERATGIVPEVDAATQRLFDRGHAAEAAARQYVEARIREDLYPVILSREVDGLPLSASLDGQTMDGDVIWEHKLFSESLVAQVLAGELEPHYYWQLEHQLLVSGADRVIFTTSDGTQENEASMVYRPVPGRAEALIAGWKQFERDIAEYQPAPAAPAAPIGRTPETLPALSVQVQGKVLATNLDAFREHAMAVLGGINRTLNTDEDFATAETTVKWCKGVEDRLDAAESAVIGQMADVDAVIRTIKDVREEARKIRLELDRLVKTEKEARRADTIAHYVKQVGEHVAAINKTLGEYAISVPAGLAATIGAAAKGKRTIGSIVDACNQACADAKIAASQQAERVRQNVAILGEHAEHLHLFADRLELVRSKSPDDLRNLVAAREAEYRQREAARIEAERERIRAEEAARIERENHSAAVAQQAGQVPCSDEVAGSIPVGGSTIADVAQPVEHLPSKRAIAGSTPAARSTVKLGQINEAIGPLSINAEGLASLGFHPVGTERAAKLYDASQFPAMRKAMIALLESAELSAQQVAS